MPASLTSATCAPCFELDHQFRRARQFIVRVIADQFLVNAVVLQQFLRLPRIFAGDQVRFLQHAKRPQRNIFEVADRRRHQIQAARSANSSCASVVMTFLSAASLTCAARSAQSPSVVGPCQENVRQGPLSRPRNVLR